MDDSISRKAGIDAMCNACSDWCDEGVCKKVSAIQKLPSAQPVADDDLVSREAVKKWLERWDGYIDMDIVRRMQYRVIDIPSTQPERNVGTCDECIHKYRFDYEPPCKMCIRIASKGRDGDYFCKEGESE